MTDRETLENEIVRLVTTSTDGVSLSNALFSPPDGLFCMLAPEQADRPAMLNSDLYRVAQDRIHDLMEIEDECLAKARVKIAKLAQSLPVKGLQTIESSH